MDREDVAVRSDGYGKLDRPALISVVRSERGGIAMRLKRIAAAIFCVVSIVAATAWLTAQVVAVKPVPPKVMTGADVGFRVEGIRGNTPVGVVVVRINGEWVEADIAKVGTRTLQP
jgi:hypothetical protein